MTKPVLFIPSRPSDLSAEQLRLMNQVLDAECFRLVANVIARYLNVTVSEPEPIATYRGFKPIDPVLPVLPTTRSITRASQLVRCRYPDKPSYQMHLALIQARNKNLTT